MPDCIDNCHGGPQGEQGQVCDQVPLEGARAPGQGPEEQQGDQGQEQELWEQEQEVQQAKVEDVGQDPENGFTRPFPTKNYKLTDRTGTRTGPTLVERARPRPCKEKLELHIFLGKHIWSDS